MHQHSAYSTGTGRAVVPFALRRTWLSLIRRAPPAWRRCSACRATGCSSKTSSRTPTTATSWRSCARLWRR
eukprot:324549-Prymnesium_polylepis.1